MTVTVTFTVHVRNWNGGWELHSTHTRLIDALADADQVKRANKAWRLEIQHHIATIAMEGNADAEVRA